MRHMNIMVKPSSSQCNLRCQYCFYHDETLNREIASYGNMRKETVDLLLQKVEASDAESVSFVFQGGEPMLAGLEFYEYFVDRMGKCQKEKGIEVFYSLQTNGTLLDDAWTEFFRRCHFLVGISLDGTKAVHDALRTDGHGTLTYAKVMEGIRLLEKYEVAYNILCVVSHLNARQGEKIYKSFRKQGFRFLQFIPCLDPLGTQHENSGVFLTSEQYGVFLKDVFKLWYEDFKRGTRISIRLFDNILELLLGYHASSCDMAGFCHGHFVVEADGSVYPCDFYVLDEWKIGNVEQNSFQEMEQGAVFSTFREVSSYISAECRVCQYFVLCRGGCRRNREPFVNGHPGSNRLCSGMRAFYQYSLPRFREIAANLAKPEQKSS